MGIPRNVIVIVGKTGAHDRIVLGGHFEQVMMRDVYRACYMVVYFVLPVS